MNLTITSKERDNVPFIRGSTTINHLIRMKNELTLAQYVILDFIISYRESSTKNEPITFGKIWVMTGIIHTEAQVVLKELMLKNLISVDENKHIQVAESYKRQFQNNGNFDEFWKIEPKGNKAAAMRAYEKLIRKYPHDKICSKYKDYLEFCNKSGRYKLDTSTWLHPKNGNMETEWVEVKKPEQKKEETPPNTLDYDFINK